MPTTKPGQKRYQIVLDEGGEVYSTLLEWAKKRGLTPGKATRCILADWSDAMSGKANPFAAAIAAAAGGNGGAAPGLLPTPFPELERSAEEKAREAALLQAAEQFM
jgi:hypothetical protein